MPHHSQTVHRIRFVGSESLDWKTNARSGTRSWIFHQAINQENIHIGVNDNIAILRNHPFHQDSLDSMSISSSDLNSNPRPKAILLEGKVLGVKSARDGMVNFIVTDNTAGGLTTLCIPAKATAISTDGGWIMKAKPLRGQKGPVVRYPTRIRAHDLKTPAARKRPGAVSPTFAPYPY